MFFLAFPLLQRHHPRTMQSDPILLGMMEHSREGENKLSVCITSLANAILEKSGVKLQGGVYVTLFLMACSNPCSPQLTIVNGA